MKRVLALFLSMLVLTSLFAGCGAAPAPTTATTVETKAAPADTVAVTAQVKKGATIAFLFQDLETEFWVAGHKAIIETLKSKGVNVIERNGNQDANKSLEQAKDAIAQKVDGIILIPQDGDSAVTIAKLCNSAGIPLGVFNRPPSNKDGKCIVAVADNEAIAKTACEHLAVEAKKLNRKVTHLILVGDLGDPNAVGRKKGFYDVIDANPDLFNKPVEVPTKWDAPTALANLKSAMQANPNIDVLFTSSDFLFPTIKSVLEPMGKWKKIGEKGHVIMAGLDGDSNAGKLLDDKFIDSTGVQDLYFEASSILDNLLAAISSGDKTPDKWVPDPGFALTQANMDQKRMDMWGNKLRQEKGEIK
jgi:ABC-type sugar transport system substrate-binding protein